MAFDRSEGAATRREVLRRSPAPGDAGEAFSNGRVVCPACTARPLAADSFALPLNGANPRTVCFFASPLRAVCTASRWIAVTGVLFSPAPPRMISRRNARHDLVKRQVVSSRARTVIGGGGFRCQRELLKKIGVWLSKIALQRSMASPILCFRSSCQTRIDCRLVDWAVAKGQQRHHRQSRRVRLEQPTGSP